MAVIYLRCCEKGLTFLEVLFEAYCEFIMLVYTYIYMPIGWMAIHVFSCPNQRSSTRYGFTILVGIKRRVYGLIAFTQVFVRMQIPF